MNKKDLLRKNSEYILYLLNLQKTFDELRKNISDNQLKKVFKQLYNSIDEILETHEKQKRIENIERILKQ